MAALLWQSFIVQTHIHYPAAPVHLAASVSHAGHSGDTPSDCPICRELGQAAVYLAPTLPLFMEPAPAHVLALASPISAAMFVAFAPAWRSRAPPLQPRA